MPPIPFFPQSLGRIACVLLASLWLLPAAALRADVSIGRAGDKKNKDKQEVPTPEPHSTTKHYASGRATTIELVASVGNTRQVYFTIREQPQNGTLSEVRPSPDANKALVTYTPRPDAPLTDRFTFVCRLEGGNTSAPGEITLIGQKVEPKLNIVEYPHFGNSFIGGELSARVVVKNEGPAPFAQEVKWSPPWSGPTYLQIDAGDSREFPLLFRSDTPGYFRLEQEIQAGNPASKVVTSAECVRGLIVSPGAVSLAYNASTRGRDATISLSNNRDEVASVRITLPDRLKSLIEISVQPHEKKPLLLNLEPEDIEAFQGQVRFETQGESQSISVAATPKPGELQVVEPVDRVVNFGELTQRAEGASSVILRNSGGQPLAIQAVANPPARLDTNNEAFRLQPGETRTLSIKFSGASLGLYSGQLSLQASGSEQVLSLKGVVRMEPETPQTDIAATVRPRIGTSVEASPVESSNEYHDPRPLTRIQALYTAVLATEGIPIPSTMINPYLEKVEGIKVLNRSSTAVTVEWNKPKVAPANWIVEQAFYMFDRKTNIYGKFWQQYPNYKVVSTSGDKVGVRINALKAGSRYETRVLAQDRDGKVSQPSATFMMLTSPPWRVPGWVWRVLIFAGLGIALYFLHRVRRGDFAGPF